MPPRQRRASVKTAQDDFRRQVPARTPLARLCVRARHRSHGLATVVRLPTLVRSPMLSHGRARPHGLGEGFALVEPREASRRPSTSATESLREHDRGRSKLRAPRRQSPADAAPVADGCGEYVSTRELSIAVRTRAARGQPSFHGPGIGSRRLPAFIDPTPPCAIARVESFAPPRSARTPRVASSSCGGLEPSRRTRAPLPALDASSPWCRSAVKRHDPRKDRREHRRSFRQGCSRHVPAKGYALNSSRGAFRRQSTLVRAGASTACPQAVDCS